jgi:hypothetical protein
MKETTETCHTATLGDPLTSFYVSSLARMKAAGVPFLVGGAFAYSRYSGIHRDTKDLDVFVRPSDVPSTLALFEKAGYQTKIPFPHWLAKVYCDDRMFMDVIFSSGNGVARVDDQWFEHAVEHDVLGLTVCLCPPEEMIWSKAFIQERERYDGADVAHLIRELGPTLSWERLLVRFGDDWPVLFSHLVLFRYIYPNRRQAVPDWVIDELSQRFLELPAKPNVRVCRGPVLSREQYLHDINNLDYEDARVEPHGRMTPAEVEIWTAAINDKR